MKIRLDDMTIDEVKILYNSMFKDLISKNKLDEIYNNYSEKYNKMKNAESEGYKAPSGMGRRFNYLKNILYGWYIEELFYELLKSNKSIKSIELTGNDSEHKFIYDEKTKTIKICGKKTTTPDYLITLKNGKSIYLELKTAATEIYSIKIGNVSQLQKNMGYTSIYSLIIMVDLINAKYEIKDLEYFLNIIPFVNNRMEGQLCYDFPKPTKQFSEIKSESFEKYIKTDMFNNEEIKKYRCLFLAEQKQDKKLIQEIKNKISLDKLTQKFNINKKEYELASQKLIDKTDIIITKTWDDYIEDLNNNV